MKIFRHKYKALSGRETADKIIKVMDESFHPLTEEQKRELRESFGDRGMLGNLQMPFQVYDWKNVYPHGRNSWWRATILFFFLFWILIQPIMFIYWIINGSYMIPMETKLNKFMMVWYQNIFE